MKKLITLLASVLVVTCSFAQMTEQKLAEKVKISFPGVPTSQSGENNANVYTYFTKDSTLGYMAVSVDLGALGLQEAMINAAGDQIWEQMKAPMMSKLTGAVLTKDEITKFKGRSALYMEIDGAKSDAPLLKGRRTFGYSFFVGAVLINLTYYVTSPSATRDDAKAFFDSVVIAD